MKKGFTLIELLAVIVIVAIITLIATPIISNVVNNSKVGALKSSAYGILEASNLYYAQNGSKGIRFDINDNIVSSNDTTKLLNYKGSIKRGTVIIDKKGNTTICITDGKNAAYKNYNDNDITTVTKETCNIPENRSIVYLESSGATRNEYTNQELTDELLNIKDEIASLKTQNETLASIINENKNNISTVQNTLNTTNTNLELVSSVANNASTKTELANLSSIVSGHNTSINKLNNDLATKITDTPIYTYDFSNSPSNWYDGLISTVKNAPSYSDVNYSSQLGIEGRFIGYKNASSCVGIMVTRNNVIQIYFNLSISKMYLKHLNDF